MTKLPISTILLRSIGGAGGIALMAYLATASHFPLMTIPFATSIVMVLGGPELKPARPRCVLGGHIICATAGIMCTQVLGYDIWVAAFAIGLAIALMHLFDAFHPPAGISPIIIAASHASPVFILTPVMTGAIILIAFAYVFHRITGEKWPVKQPD
ncbi:MAG: HPP family protein [Micropepsaceae bacterium]